MEIKDGIEGNGVLISKQSLRNANEYSPAPTKGRTNANENQ